MEKLIKYKLCNEKIYVGCVISNVVYELRDKYLHLEGLYIDMI